MPTTADRLLRDFIRYTGDGLPGEPAARPLPVGDPASGQHNPSKKDFRDAINSVTGSADDATAAAIAANAAAANANAAVGLHAKPYVILALGQSNMMGWGEATDGDKAPDPGVYFWNNPSSGSIGTGSQWNVGTFGTAPLNVPATVGEGYANNLAFHAAKRLRQQLNRPIYVIVIARGAHRIESFIPAATVTAMGWTRDGGLDLYTMMANNLSAALAAVPGAPSTVDCVMVHQGEANSLSDPPELYARKVKIALEGIEALGYVHRSRTPVVLGEIAPGAGTTNHTRHRWGLRRLKDTWGLDKWRGLKLVSSQGIPTVSTGNVHFSGAGLEALGRMYAEALTTIQDDYELDYSDTDYSVDGSLLWACAYPYREVRDYAGRLPIALDFPTVSTVNHATLGWSYVAPANTVTALGHRRLVRLPVSRAVRVDYEIIALSGSGTAHSAFVWQYDKDRVLIGAAFAVPPSSPATTGAGRSRVSRTFKRNGSSETADVTLAATTEYIALGVSIGADPTSGEAAFNILDMAVG